jgi:hypothetical protein
MAMSERSFKPGDRVRTRISVGAYTSAGDVGTVVREDQATGMYIVRFDVNRSPKPYRDVACFTKELVLVQPKGAKQ